MNLLEPKFLEILRNPEIKNVLLVGCGGGFDFIHGMLLYPALMELNKNVVIGSYSFGLTDKINCEMLNIPGINDIQIKLCTGSITPDPHYAPEINVCRYLDAVYPETLHSVYAYYARDFNVGKLKRLYEYLCEKHSVDCIIAVDGGSDSLMTGDEAGLGDVIEDLVSVTAISLLSCDIPKLLFTVGLGADRFNDVSDASALRAVSELQRIGGYLGSLGLDNSAASFIFYKNCIEYIYDKQTFRSTVAGFILGGIEGYYGNEEVPVYLNRKFKSKDKFAFWPVMGFLFAFDIVKVAERSHLPEVIRKCPSVPHTWKAVTAFRQSIREKIRKIENLPLHEDMRSVERYNFTTGSLEGGVYDELPEL